MDESTVQNLAESFYQIVLLKTVFQVNIRFVFSSINPSRRQRFTPEIFRSKVLPRFFE